MARLNEPPVAPAATSSIATGVATATGGTESVEALKRRFVRQNRELAKNNSSQSLRIRSLELEVSKLLSDNLDLREQVLGLQHELHNARGAATSQAVMRVKCDLRAKIAELNGLVDGLDDVQDEEEKMPSVEKSRILSPSQRQYRERQPLADLMQDALMPTISENKLYPRRTLDAEEIRAIRLSNHSTSSGSPDLGPPPVAHFDTEAPIKFSSSQESEPQASPVSPKVSEEELLPSVNLETRRRRRDSSSRIEIRRHSILAQSPEKAENEAATTILRTGAKRKLADRDTEKPIKPPSKDDFTFSRKACAGQTEPEPEIKIEEPAPELWKEEAPKPAADAPKPVRKVLGDKSTNMSPKKSSARTGKPPKDDFKKPAPKLAASKDKERPSSRARQVSSIPQPLPQDEIPPTFEIPPPEPIAPEQIEPETPATHDLFSPITSEPSTAMKPEARDTPPPSDLSSLSNTTEGGIRPSRRARSAVNYAEPSLIAKMRRPDKQMVDAISGIQDPRRTMGSSKERKSSGGSTSVPRTVLIKKEPDDDESGWKSTSHMIEGSPLRERSTDKHPLATTTATATEDSIATKPSNSAATLSSVIATSRKRREQLERRDSQPFGPDQDAKKAEMDLYDFKDTSSPATDSSSTRAPSPEGKQRGPRRHSSVPKDGSVASTQRVASRRRSMML